MSIEKNNLQYENSFQNTISYKFLIDYTDVV